MHLSIKPHQFPHRVNVAHRAVKDVMDGWARAGDKRSLGMSLTLLADSMFHHRFNGDKRHALAVVNIITDAMGKL